MRYHKGRWRQHMRKPLRKFRRFFCKVMNRKGKGKSKKRRRRPTGQSIISYLYTISDTDYAELFFSKRGKGNGKNRSSGKGFGRPEVNPRGRDGQSMKCPGQGGECLSTTHLGRDCPHEKGPGTGHQRSIDNAAAHVAEDTTYTSDMSTIFMITF